ncbi:MAG: glutamate-1-semialdehyde 2,1-aminomutase [Candidatus Omnitrophica bacterium]|nr:glutamate-1-semialdehyde 2,1-aminomutase [Candidatus Omnitrophota bacterium]
MALNSWVEAQRHLAGGVNSPVRAFKAVGGEPVFIQSGKGPYIFDNQNRRYVDFCLSWGAILLGHAYPSVTRVIAHQAKKGTSFGAPTEAETALAREIKKAFPGMEKIRFTSSGTEAVMSAVRLARGVTKRDRIVKFEGCYHGHVDSLLVKAGSGLATLGLAESAGVPEELARLTTVLPYNDARGAQKFFQKNKDIACVIVEPIAANMGVVPAKQEFLEELRKLTKINDSLLVFDEVITGYRVGYGGAQHLYKIDPDITILGKIIGGGLPVGAFGAKAGIMDHLAPLGNVYQAGTLSGNPLSMAAGLAVLSGLSKKFYAPLNARTKNFLSEARLIFKKKNKKVAIREAGSMFTTFFEDKRTENFRRFFHQMLSAGVYFPPSAFEASFLSAAHTERELDGVLKKIFTKIS